MAAGHVHHQGLAGDARQQLLDLRRRPAMCRSGRAGLRGDRKESRGARILALVQGMPVTGNGLRAARTR